MKKTALLVLLVFIFITPLFAATDVDGRTDRGPLARIAMVEGRGLLNFLGYPAELFMTGAREMKMHKKLWPATYPLRFFQNTLIRLSTILYDVLFYPPVVLFTDDLTPLTEPMGLPEYPWQMY